MADAPSAFSPWVEATTAAGDVAPSPFSDWVEATTASDENSPSEFSDWVEASLSTGDVTPSEFSDWVEATTYAPPTAAGQRFTGSGMVPIGRQRWTGTEMVPMGGGSGGPGTPAVTKLPSAFSNWVTADLRSATDWKKPLMGLIGPDESSFQQMNNEMGPVLIRRTYNTGLPSHANQSAMWSDVAQKRISLYSFKPNVLTFPGSSTARAQLRSFLATVPAGHELYMMGYHEPEDNINAGDFTLAQWGACQNAIATEVKSMGRSELKTAFCLMGPWTFDSRSPYFNYNWTGVVDMDLIDLVGVDPYGKSPNSPENQYSLERLMTVRNSGSGGGSALSMMERLRTWGKPISLMEWGKLYEGPTVAPEQVVATFIRDGFEWMCDWNQQNPDVPIHSAAYYNMTITDDDTPLTTAVEKAAMRDVIAASKIPVGA